MPQVDEVQTVVLPGAVTIGAIVNIFGLYHCAGLPSMTVLGLNATGTYLQVAVTRRTQSAASAAVAMLG